MNLLTRYPLRIFLPVLIAVCASLVALLAYFNSRPVVLRSLEQIAGSEMETELQRVQGVVQFLLRQDLHEGVRTMIAGFGSVAGHELLFLTDSTGKIIASTRLEDIGSHWRRVEWGAYLGYIERYVGTLGIKIEYGGGPIQGYADVCIADSEHSLRPDACGFLYYRRNIDERKHTILNTLLNEAVRNGVGVFLIALVLLWILDRQLTVRLQKLADTAKGFAKGDRKTRARLGGRDELAQIGGAFDRMLDIVEKDQDILTLSEARHRAVLETAVDGIISINTAGQIESFNPAAERLFGYRVDEVHSKNIKILMPSPYREDHDDYLARYLKTGEKRIIGIGREVEGRRKDGTIFPMELSVSELWTGELRTFTGIIRDISQRKRSEEALRVSEEMLRLTLDNAPIGIATLDLDGHFLRINPLFCQMLGHAEQDFLKEKLENIVHPDDRIESLRLLEKSTHGEVNPYAQKARLMRRDGSIMHAVLHIGTVLDENNKPVMFVIQMQDLTERRQAEEDAREQRERLTHVARLSTLGELTASIAHEVNQPLTAIASYAEACQRLIEAGDMDSEELLHAMQQSGKQAHRAGDVIRRLRKFVRKQDSIKEGVDINRLIEDIVELARVDTRLHGKPIRFRLERGLPVVVADGVQIQQVLLNLILNALDAMPTGKEFANSESITISTERADSDTILISVKDCGEGVSDKIAENLFDAFHTTKKAGIGIGLSICRSIIDAHGGQLNFKNNPDGGATFYFTLPTDTGEPYGPS